MFINRDWTRTENDDFLIKIQPQLQDNKEAVPVYINNQVIGWKIQHRYE